MSECCIGRVDLAQQLIHLKMPYLFVFGLTIHSKTAGQFEDEATFALKTTIVRLSYESIE